MIVLDIEHARQAVEGLREFVERLKDDDDPGPAEGLTVGELDDMLGLLALLGVMLRKR